MKKHFLVFALILFAIFILRLPSLFEPFWYGDEGIFAAVGRSMNLGGVLYQDAWDNKPPMIYITYAAIFKFFSVSMFWLHLTATIIVLTTAAVIYEIGQAVYGEKRALAASFIFGFLTSLRLIEGNLALTEIFMILPICLAMLLGVKRKFDLLSLFGAGILFAIASLYKQVGAFEAGALGIFLFLYFGSFKEFFVKGAALTAGFIIPYALTIAYFYPKKLLDDYIFAAYTYYRIYLAESPKYAGLINIAKFLPIVSAGTYGIWKKIHGKVEMTHLFLLWMAFSFLGSYFSGRTYGHYLVQAAPAFSLVLASVNFRFKFNKVGIIFAVFFFVPIVFLTKTLFFDFLSAGPLNQIGYWQNFIDRAKGVKSIDSYNNYFDGNVNSIMALADMLRVNDAFGKSVYIWGDYPWLYAIADLKNPSRYVTSFHVFGVPNGKEEVAANLKGSLPLYVIKPQSSIGYFSELENMLSSKYTFVAKIENSEVWLRK